MPAERLRREYEAVGFFLSGHPLDDYAAVLKKLRVQPWAEFARAVKAGATAGRVAATVVSRIERRTRTGNKMGIIGSVRSERSFRGGYLFGGTCRTSRPA